MSSPFMFIHRVPTDSAIEIKSALDSLLEVLRNFIDMSADITTEEFGDDTDIKIVIQIKGVK
jgi:hypothetical protein